MSEADCLEDGADYYEIYGKECDGDCRNCEIKDVCEDFSL